MLLKRRRARAAIALSEAQRDSFRALIYDDNPMHTRMRFTVASLQRLIKQDGLSELESNLENVMNIILAHVTSERQKGPL
jgi:hypothetical protein